MASDKSPKPFDPREHIPSNWVMPSNYTGGKLKESAVRPFYSRPLTWIAFLMVVPAFVLVIYIAFSRTDTVKPQRDASDFEKNVTKVVGPEGSDPVKSGTDPKAEKTPEGMVKLKYSTGNVEMDLYRKEGYAVHEKPKKKDDFMGAPINATGSSDIEDRAKGPGGKDPKVPE